MRFEDLRVKDIFLDKKNYYVVDSTEYKSQVLSRLPNIPDLHILVLENGRIYGVYHLGLLIEIQRDGILEDLLDSFSVPVLCWESRIKEVEEAFEKDNTHFLLIKDKGIELVICEKMLYQIRAKIQEGLTRLIETISTQTFPYDYKKIFSVIRNLVKFDRACTAQIKRGFKVEGKIFGFFHKIRTDYLSGHLIDYLSLGEIEGLKTAYIPDAKRSQFFLINYKYLRAYRTIYFVPIRSIYGEMLGFISFLKKEKDGFSAFEQHLLFEAGEVLKSVLSNEAVYGLLEERIKERTYHLEILYELSKRIGYSLDLYEVIHIILENLRRVIDYDLAISLIKRGGKVDIIIKYCHPVSKRFLKRAKERAKKAFSKLADVRLPLGSEKELYSPIYNEKDPPIDGKISSYFRIPLTYDKETLGILYIVSHKEHHFTREQINLLRSIASQASLAVAKLNEIIKKESLRLQSIFNAMDEAVAFISEEGQVLTSNDAFNCLLPSKDLRKMPDLFRLVDKTIKEKGYQKVEERIIKNGKERICEIKTQYIPYEEEKHGVILIVRDVTEERNLEEILRQREKLASVGLLASGVAHEVNNPLTSVIGFSQLLLARDYPPEIRDYLKKIHNEAERASKILKNLLTFARRKRPEKSLTNVNEALKKALDLRAYELKVDNIRVVKRLSPLPATMADIQQLQQVFLNLIINAQQAIRQVKERGTIFVSSRVDKKRNKIIVEIKDDGPGIPKEHLTHIFDPFFTTKQRGTGLGLSVSYGIIHEHGGTIYASNNPDKGAKFTIELPIILPKEEEIVDKRPTPVLSKKLILVIDDEKNICELIKQILSAEGHLVKTLSSGVEALKFLKKNRPDVIITDIKMPGMDGSRIYEEIKRIDSNLAKRIVFITGDILNKETQAFLEKTGALNLPKPFSINELKDIVYDALNV